MIYRAKNASSHFPLRPRLVTQLLDVGSISKEHEAIPKDNNLNHPRGGLVLAKEFVKNGLPILLCQLNRTDSSPLNGFV